MSKDIPIYKPVAGSIPHKVLSFLKACPDEELTRHDIAVKFDAAQTSIDSQLRLPESRGALVRTKNREMEVVWRLGKPEMSDLGGDEPFERSDKQQNIDDLAKAFSSAGQRNAEAKAAGKLMPFDSPILDSAEDLLPETDQTRRAEQIKKYRAWLDRFNVGSAAEFDRSLIRDVAHIAGKYGKDSGKEFRCSHGKAAAKAVIVRLS